MKAIEQQATDAILYRLGRHSVAIVNRIRTVGYDPMTKRRGDGEEAGSGFAGRWADHHFILTARHVVEKARPSDLRVFASRLEVLSIGPHLTSGGKTLLMRHL